MPLGTWASDPAPRTAQQFAAWSAAGVQVQASDRWWITSELHWRRSGGLAQPMQTGWLLAPEYRTGPWSVQAGYAFWNTDPYGAFRTPAPQREHRGWAQVGWQHGLGRVSLDHRLRAEYRSLERFTVGPEGPAQLGFRPVGRLRYRTRLVAALNSKQKGAGEWQAILQKEWMVRYGDHSFVGVFDQVRPAVQLAFRPVHHLQISAGYQLHYLVRSNGLHEELNHTLLLGALWRLPKKVRATPPALIAARPPVASGR